MRLGHRFIGLAFLGLAAGLAWSDEIYLGTSKIEVTITKVSIQGFDYRLEGGGSGQAALARVVRVVFTNTPPEYDQGVEAMNNNRYEEAIKKFEQALKAGETVWVPQYAPWQIANCQAGLGRMAEAMATVKKLLEKVPDTRFLPDARVLLGRLELARGKVQEALAEFKELETLSQKMEGGQGKVFYYRAQVWSGRALLQAGQPDKAQELFAKVRSTGSAYPALHLQATVGEGQALVAKKQLSRAQGLFDDAIEKSPVKDVERAPVEQRELLAQAYNGLGECWYNQEPKPDLDKALKSFLKVILLLADDLPEENAKALYHAAKCFHRMRDQNKEWAGRARDLSHELKSKYPGSRWARLP